jgi:hypothetical protein
MLPRRRLRPTLDDGAQMRDRTNKKSAENLLTEFTFDLLHDGRE